MSKTEKSKKAATAASKKKAGTKTTGEDTIIIDGSNKKQCSSSSAPLWSLTQTKGFTINPYSKGSKNKVDIVVHNSGVPTEHCQPTIKLALGGKSVEIELKLPESHFTNEQAESKPLTPTPLGTMPTRTRWTSCTARETKRSMDSSVEPPKS